jgi:hypothetical protein
MWVFPSISSSIWLEEGMIYDATLSRYWFWADNRNGSNFAYHSTALSAPLNTDIPIGMHYHGSNIWYLQRGDVGSYATSTPLTGPAARADAGTEVTSTAGKVYGTELLLAYELSGTTTQIFGWQATGYPAATLSPVQPPNVSWSGGTYKGILASYNSTGSC